MPDFNPSDDAYGIKSGNTSGANVAEKLLGSRNSGTSYSMVHNPSGTVFQYMYIGPRPISAVGYFAIHRGHLIFDLSGASGTVISADLCLYAYTADSGGTINNGYSFYVVGHDYGGALNAAADDVNPTNNTTGDWTSTSVPTYSSEITVNGVSADDKITASLNSTAITEINSVIGSGDFDVGLIAKDDYKADFTLLSYNDGFGYNGIQVHSVDSTDTAYRPVLELTYATPPILPRLSVKSGQINVKGGTLTIK